MSALAARAAMCQLAEWANADESLVAAALLHDVGPLPRPPRRSPARTMSTTAHELLAIPFLSAGFDEAVTEPVRLHVRGQALPRPAWIRTTPAALAGVAAFAGPAGRLR